MGFKLAIEFPTEEMREEVLGWLSDGGGEYEIGKAIEQLLGVGALFDYKGAYPSWGWDGTGDPTVVVSVSTESSGDEKEAPFFVGDCTCRPIVVPGISTYIGGMDDCPVHGFGPGDPENGF